MDKNDYLDKFKSLKRLELKKYCRYISRQTDGQLGKNIKYRYLIIEQNWINATLDNEYEFLTYCAVEYINAKKGIVQKDEVPIELKGVLYATWLREFSDSMDFEEFYRNYIQG